MTPTNAAPICPVCNERKVTIGNAAGRWICFPCFMEERRIEVETMARNEPKKDLKVDGESFIIE
jgi:hypothetical protein